MPSVTRGTITIDLPSTWKLEPKRRGPALAPDEELSPEQVAQTFGEHFKEVEVLPLAPTDEVPATSARRRGSAAGKPRAERASLRVGVRADENAVLLVVQDGVYTWVHGDIAESTRKARGVAGRMVAFELELKPTATIRRSKTRGFKPSILLKPLKVIVFKFVAGVAVGQLVKRFERDVKTGLVWIQSSDPENHWTSLQAGDKGPTLPKGRQACVLLLVHGTFSSTQGGYGHLKASPAGQQFLDRALKHYDAVIGFDHRTLSEDPKENADQLKDVLESMDRGDGIVIDAVTHSRGALVLRCLVEHLFAPTGSIRVNRAVMVAGPNAGTRLAASDRWSDFVDLYTNIVVGGSNLVRLALPQSALATTILSESMKGIAALVKAITTAAVDASMAPGLAAMDPSGAFIKQINQHQPGQPSPDQIWYAAITTNYEPQVLSGPGSLPARLGFAIGDAAIDKLMGAKNDLVVDVPSMTSVDLPMQYFKDVFNVPDGLATYHTTYFNQFSVVQRLGAWLSIDTIPNDPDSGPSGGGATALPAGGTGRIVVVDAGASREVADGLVKADDSDFAVVRRRTRGGAVEHVAIEREDFDKAISGMGSGEVLARALGSRRQPSLEIAIGAYRDAIRYSPARSAKGAAVLMRGDRPVGVLPGRRPGLTHAKPRRGVPRTTLKPTSGRRRKPVDLETRIGAIMPDRIDLDDKDLVLVELSVDELQTAVGAGSVHGLFKPSSSKPITVHAIGKSNASIVGEDQVQVEVPQPGDPRMLQFSVRGDLVGPGQVAIIAAQGPVVLVRLLLDFEVVEPRETTAPSRVGAASISVSRVVERTEPTAPCDKIWVEETKSVGEVTVDGGAQFITFETAFDVRYISESDDIRERGVTRPIKGDRMTYVTELYKKIEADWGTSHGDTAAFHDALKSYGGQLFDQLVPEHIQKVLWDNKDRIKTIQVTSDDPYIPWELVHLKGPVGRMPKEDMFLADMGLVRWLDGAGAPRRSFSVGKKARYVLAPEYPAGSGWELDTAKEAKLLRERYGARSVDPTWQGLRALIETPGKFDLLHFAGHGAAPAENIERAALVLAVREDEAGSWEPWTVDATMVEQFTNLGSLSGGRPVVFLNACQVGRAGYQLTGVGGFAQAFLRGGAGAFVSCLWSVGDEPAIAFCRTFYNALARGKTIVRAASEARTRARADGDPTWLAYVVYGRPEATVTFR